MAYHNNGGLRAYNTGIQGEEFALEYCKNLGMILLKTRYKTRFGEIDLIMKQKNTICFIEVKYRKNGFIGDGLYAVTRSKQRKLLMCAEKYIQDNNIQCDVRMDVLEIVNNNYNYIENAFELTDIF